MYFIRKQTDSPLVKKMVLALEKTNSAHLSNFKMLLQDIAEGITSLLLRVLSTATIFYIHNYIISRRRKVG